MQGGFCNLLYCITGMITAITDELRQYERACRLRYTDSKPSWLLKHVESEIVV